MPNVTRVIAGRCVELTDSSGKPHCAVRGDTVTMTEAEANRLDALLGGFAPGLILAKTGDTPAQVAASVVAASASWDAFYAHTGPPPAELRPKSWA